MAPFQKETPIASNALVDVNNIPVQHPMGNILTNRIPGRGLKFGFPPITSIIKPFSGYPVSYALLGGLLGSGYGYMLMKKAATRRYITQRWDDDENMGYVFWGGLIGLCVGKFTGNIISIMK